jgi:heat shock protein HslJ
MQVRPGPGPTARGAVALALIVAVLSVALTACTNRSLTDQTWLLAATTISSPTFSGIVPPEWMTKYTIEFAEDGTWTGKADCNAVSGTYTTSGNDEITIVRGPSTLAVCPEGSFADLYLEGLARAESYKVSAEQLVLGLGGDDTFSFASQPEE